MKTPPSTVSPATTAALDHRLFVDARDCGWTLSDREERSVHKLKALYPELQQWPERAVFVAWTAYSQWLHDCGWTEPKDRSELLLNFIAWIQQHGQWPWSTHADKLASMKSLWAAQ